MIGVYLVYSGLDYDGSNVVAVLTDKDKAIAKAKSELEGRTACDYAVVEWREIDSDHKERIAFFHINPEVKF